MRIENELRLNYGDVLIRPKRSTMGSRSEVDLVKTYRFETHTYQGIPIMAANMDGVGTFDMAVALGNIGLFTCLTKTYSAAELIKFFNDDPQNKEHAAMSMGITDVDLKKLSDVMLHTELRYLCVDVANGYTKMFADRIAFIRSQYKSLTIFAGNVVTADQTQELILAGANFVKCGIGPGSVCTTRIKTGVGYPQLSAVMECADAAHGLGGFVIADGGCTTPGDVAKAFSAGADFVMLGGMLSGTDEGGGEVIEKRYKINEVTFDGAPMFEVKKFVQFYGMSSETANTKHFGGLKGYRTTEGRTVLVDYKGSAEGVVQDILGGLRSTCTYVGAKTLKSLPKCATFIRCNDTHNRVYEGRTIGY